MRRSVLIAGSVAQKPRHGGHTWVFLQYLLGFRRLGWDVFFVDRLDDDTSVDAAGRATSVEQSYNLSFLRQTMSRFGLDGCWGLIQGDLRSVIDLSRAELLERIAKADLFLNVMGFVDEPELLRRARRRVFLDIDPGFGQMWRDLKLCDPFEGHDQFVTIGQNIGRRDCLIPNCGLDWITTPQPVVLERWPVTPAPRPDEGAFTSVVSWRGAYGPLEHGGRVYGLRAHELRKFASLPCVTGLPFELALDIHPGDAKDKAMLSDNGWSIVPPTEVAGDPWAYQEFIRRSRAEFMVAKNIYVQARSGWVSDRSICYLASGRPVVAQDTGLSELYPTGEGFILFSDAQEAADAVRRVWRDYDCHARAARAFAESHFGSDKVLSNLVSRLGID